MKTPPKTEMAAKNRNFLVREFIDNQIKIAHYNNDNKVENREIDRALEVALEIFVNFVTFETEDVLNDDQHTHKYTIQNILEDLLILEQDEEKKKEVQEYAEIWLQDWSLVLSSWTFLMLPFVDIKDRIISDKYKGPMYLIEVITVGVIQKLILGSSSTRLQWLATLLTM